MITFSQFCDNFTKAERADSYSYEAKEALYELISEAFEDEELLSDPIAICCYFSEYENHDVLLAAYDSTISVDDGLTGEERRAAIEEKFIEYTYLQVTETGTVVIQDF